MRKFRKRVLHILTQKLLFKRCVNAKNMFFEFYLQTNLSQQTNLILLIIEITIIF